MMPAYREIEVNIFSAHDLRDVRNFGGRMNPYVVAWIHPDFKACTHTDVKGGTDPHWNSKLLLICDEALLDHPQDAVVHFELYDAGSTSDRIIGALALPLSELPGKFATLKEPSDPVFLNLPVRRPSGREQGAMDFTVKIGGVAKIQPVPDPLHEARTESMAEEPSSVARCCGLHFYHEAHSFHRQNVLVSRGWKHTADRMVEWAMWKLAQSDVHIHMPGGGLLSVYYVMTSFTDNVTLFSENLVVRTGLSHRVLQGPLCELSMEELGLLRDSLHRSFYFLPCNGLDFNIQSRSRHYKLWVTPLN